MGRKVKKILTIIGGILTVAAFLTLCYKVDLRWVKTESYAKDAKAIYERIAGVEKRVEQQIKLDKAQKLQERIWELERYYRGRSMPDPVRREIRDHQIEIKRIYHETGAPGG